MSNKSNVITKNEEIILEIVERENPITMKQIIERTKEQKEWADSTIKTFVRRLVKKGMVEVEEKEVQYFIPKSSREKRGIAALHEVFDKFYEGKWQKAVLSFADDEKITQEELEKALNFIRDFKQ